MDEPSWSSGNEAAGITSEFADAFLTALQAGVNVAPSYCDRPHRARDLRPPDSSETVVTPPVVGLATARIRRRKVPGG